MEKNNHKKIMVASAGLSAALLAIGMLLGDAAVLGNLLIISIFLVAGPYFFFKYSRYMWVKGLEQEFPSFIRDLSDAVRSMPLPEALGVVKKSNYGSLTDEVRRLHNRMSWGTPFLRSLEVFEKRVRDSKLITEALTILRESYLSGGSMVNTLESITRDLLMLREAEQERSSMLRQHILIMYAIFFMFLGISFMIIFVMVPMLETQGDLSGGGGFSNQFTFSNPCRLGSGMLFPCGLYNGVSVVLGIDSQSIGAYYVALFFYALLIQGLFVGLITGQVGENSVTAGVKHGMIMVIVTLALFLFFSQLGLLPA